MSFPEIPLLVYPSLARRIGVEESLLYYICQQQLARSIEQQISMSKVQWLQLTEIWDDHKLAFLVASLSAKGVLKIVVSQDQVVITKIDDNPAADTVATIDGATDKLDNAPLERLNSKVDAVSRSLSEAVTTRISQAGSIKKERYSAPSVNGNPQMDSMQILPVYDVPPAPPARPLPVRRTENQQNVKPNNGEIIKGIGPAPSFGGYKRQSNAHDPFKKLLDDKEQQNKKLYAMTMDWEPSKLLLSTLTRNNIPHEVASSSIDEFRLYYCDRNNKERSWDQKFLAWVKNSWVKKQSADNRALSTPNQAGTKHENSQRDTREKRKRISAAIMDIHDTNW